MMDLAEEDCKKLVEQENHQEKLLRHKRRWLIGLPTSGNEAEKLNESSKFQPERPMPESLLREDDVYYETIRSSVKKLVEEHDSKNKCCILYDDMQLIHSPTDIKTLLFLINDMTNQGLFHFAKLLTGGSVKLEKTRWKLKQIIKQNLLKYNTRKIKLSNDHLLFLKNPQIFRWNPESRFIPDSGSSHAAVRKILNVLEDLPTQTLSAMHRKLRGIKDYIPELIPKRSGWARDKLIKSLRKKFLELLSKHTEGYSLQEPLVKAMEVAGLTLKLIQGHFYATNFVRFPHEMIVLQNEIAMCIKFLDQNVKLEPSMLKKIRKLLDPDAKIFERTLRGYVKNLLMEYLFECGDLDTIPRVLRKLLAILSKSSKCNYKIDEEVECILSVSATMKQVLWDVIPEHEFDLEFADVYMEDLEESDCDDVCEDNEEHTENNVSNSRNFDEEVGSTEEIEIKPADFNSDSVVGTSSMESYSSNGLKVANSARYHLVSFGNMERMETDVVMDTDLVSEKNMDQVFDKDLGLERNLVFDDGGICGNGYLDVQGASDEVSMVVYRVIGRMLGDFARMEGCELNSGDLCYLGVGNDDLKQKDCREQTTNEEDGCSIMIKAVEELIPSFAKSEEADALKGLMGSEILRQ